jgi:glycerol-3-phosphate dehydrogenase (NAD(P)+)
MKIGILGGGAWGTALAQVMAAGGHGVRLWAREAEVVDAINAAHENPLFLAGVPLSPDIHATCDIASLAHTDLTLVVTPAQHARAVLNGLPKTGRPLLLCSKGIEAGSHKLLSEVAAEVHPASAIGVLSGPTFASEVARGLPTAVTVAMDDAEDAERMAEALALPTFRTYASDDVIGAEIGGAVKNVLAIACGVVEGAGLGQNARAALIARGFAEMTRFGLARGSRAETLAGLSGLGDMVLTCSSTSSRNFSLGLGLGQGRSAADLMADRRTVAEGAFTAPVLCAAAESAGVDMPVARAVAALLDGAEVGAVIGTLLARPLTREHG